MMQVNGIITTVHDKCRMCCRGTCAGQPLLHGNGGRWNRPAGHAGFLPEKGGGTGCGSSYKRETVAENVVCIFQIGVGDEDIIGSRPGFLPAQINTTVQFRLAQDCHPRCLDTAPFTGGVLSPQVDLRRDIQPEISSPDDILPGFFSPGTGREFQNCGRPVERRARSTGR